MIRFRHTRGFINCADTIVDKISSILFCIDPVGINFKTNTDEYLNEAFLIVRRLDDANSVTEGDTWFLLCGLFKEQFSSLAPGLINVSSHKYLIAAEEIYKVYIDEIKNRLHGSCCSDDKDQCFEKSDILFAISSYEDKNHCNFCSIMSGEKFSCT